MYKALDHTIERLKYTNGVRSIVASKNQVLRTSCVQNKNKRVIDKMTRVDQSGATAADVGDVMVASANESGPSPPVNLD